MRALIMALMIPLALLNVFGGIGSAIWLAILGEWWAIGYGLVYLLLSFFLLLIVMMPYLLLAGTAAALMEKGKTFFALPLLLLSQLYICAVITAWCMLVFYLFMSRANPETFWPLLIWSYGLALGPWTWMAQKDQEGGTGDASAVATFFAQIAYIVVALVVIFGGATLIELAVIFGCIMLVVTLIQTGIGFAMLREEKRLEQM